MHGDSELVSLFLQRGADAAMKSEDGKTAADLAREKNHVAILSQLQQ
jgi:hypothetical protein